MASLLAPKQQVPHSGDPLKVWAIRFFNAAVDAYDEGEIGQMIGHLLDAIELYPDFANAHNNLGAALRKKGDSDGAIEHYSVAVRLAPDQAYPNANLGGELLIKGKLDAAILHLCHALRIDPDDDSARYNLGCALARKKDVPAAVSALAKAIELDTGHRDQARSDPDFDPIRGDPAFRKLVYNE